METAEARKGSGARRTRLSARPYVGNTSSKQAWEHQGAKSPGTSFLAEPSATLHTESILLYYQNELFSFKFHNRS